MIACCWQTEGTDCPQTKNQAKFASRATSNHSRPFDQATAKTIKTYVCNPTKTLCGLPEKLRFNLNNKRITKWKIQAALMASFNNLVKYNNVFFQKKNRQFKNSRARHFEIWELLHNGKKYSHILRPSKTWKFMVYACLFLELLRYQ